MTQTPPIVDYSNSQFFKRYGRYFDSRASYGRAPDTIIYFAFMTPTGKWSRSIWATLRFNSEHSHPDMMRRVVIEYNNLLYKKRADIKRGYKIGEIVVYSGEIK